MEPHTSVTGATPINYRLKVKYLVHFFINSLHSNTNQVLVTKVQCSYNERYEQFQSYMLGNHHMQPPNQHFSGTVRKDEWNTKEDTAWSVHEDCIVRMYCSMPKGISWAKATLNSEKIKPVA